MAEIPVPINVSFWFFNFSKNGAVWLNLSEKIISNENTDKIKINTPGNEAIKLDPPTFNIGKNKPIIVIALPAIPKYFFALTFPYLSLLFQYYILLILKSQ